MLLKQVRVENYRCIEDSNLFSLAPVTCLVGKNEAGKSALIQALYKINPAVPDCREVQVKLLFGKGLENRFICEDTFFNSPPPLMEIRMLSMGK